MCEGWSIEIGIAFHGSVVRRDRSGETANLDRVHKFNRTR
jgi:hypothetical protein